MHIASTATRLAGVDHPIANPTPVGTQQGQLAKAMEAGLSQLMPLGPPAAPSPVIEDGAVMHDLATSDLVKLAQIIQPAAPPEQVEQLTKLLQETVQAVSEGRIEWAVGRVLEAATLDPLQAEEFRALPELAPIHANIEHLIGRLTTVAKIDAESKLSQAELVMEDSGWAKLPHWDTKPETLLQIAHRLFEAGGYSNYVRSAGLADATIQSAFWGASILQPQIPPIIDLAKIEREESATAKPRTPGEATAVLLHYSWATLRARAPARFEALWRRAPLLVLLSSWFAAGVIGGVLSLIVRKISPEGWAIPLIDLGFQVWGLGLLALVGFGFWARIRQRRF